MKPIVTLALLAIAAIGFYGWIEYASHQDAERQRAAAMSLAHEAKTVPVEDPAIVRKRLLLERLRDTEHLAGALELTVPLMSDVDPGEPWSEGATLLAAWMDLRYFWPELRAMPDTKRAEIMKDSDTTRGRRICVSGTVIEIKREKSYPFHAYVGGLNQGYGMNVVRFIAVGSTEGILENKWARLCGITPGLYNYSNTSGGEVHAVGIVGAFDLSAAPPEEGY